MEQLIRSSMPVLMGFVVKKASNIKRHRAWPSRSILDRFVHEVLLNHMVKYHHSLDATFAALGDPTRRSILTTLQRGQASVTDLVRPHKISMPAIMKHLAVLEQAGLISQQKVGRVRMCRLTVAPMQQAADWLSLYRVFWDNQLDSLEKFLNQPQQEEIVPCRKPSPRQPSAHKPPQRPRRHS
jgi:DNA-binding transcriptional ArsR family regulator